MAKQVFGSSLDYNKIRIKNTRSTFLQKQGVATVPPNGHIYMYGCYQDDYSKATPARQAVFIHEMTHVWQCQNKVLSLSLTDMWNIVNYTPKAYQYTLEENKDFLQYGFEQQASIIEDYFLIQNHNLHRKQRCLNKCTPEEKSALYKKVLARFHQNPSYARKNKWRQITGKKPPSL